MTQPGTLTAEYRHVPVMLEEVLRALEVQPNSIVCDCTLGGAGHSVELAKRIGPDGALIGIDQDDAALSAARSRLSSEVPNTECFLLKGNFALLDELLTQVEVPGVDSLLFDLGVSSPQLDFPERGFSYNEEAPLDMRMDPGTQTITAAEVINTRDEADLAWILRNYGDERYASRIAHAIVSARAKTPIKTTTQLAELVRTAIPAAVRRHGGHPAKRSFQALRIEVNGELKALDQGLRAGIRWLNTHGRICVISYHSLEDRIVKHVFSELSQGCICPPDLPVCVCGNVPIIRVITRRPIRATAEEVRRNRRSHSAIMRIAEKLEK